MTSVLRDKQYMFGVKSFLVAEKVLLITNDAKLWRRPTIVDRWNKCLNEFGRYVEK